MRYTFTDAATAGRRVALQLASIRTRTCGLLVSFLLLGCTTVASQPRPAEYYAAADIETGDESLFASDAQLLSDADIQNILQHRYQPPALSRVALVPAGWTLWGGWSEEMSLATRQIDTATLDTLRSSPRVYDAAFLPSILVPKERSVPYLREAAARFQADLLLVYRSVCRSFERYRLFQPSTTRAYCSVESVLLDTRTGLVPFTTSSTQVFDAKKSAEDLNMQEAVLKAQLAAIADAMQEVAQSTVDFLHATN